MALDFGPLQNSIADACRLYGVRRLDAFGSSVRPDFDHERSDVDFLVTFQDAGPRGAADRYFGLRESLQKLLDRPVDLVIERSIRNPYFLKSVAGTRLNVYSA